MAGGHPKTTHPSPEVPPPLSPSQFPGPPYAADGCWVRGVSAGAVLATQHRRARLRRRLPSPGWVLPAGLGARVETDGAEPLHATPAPQPGSRALCRRTRTSPSRSRQREGAPSGSPATGHGEASSSLCHFPLFLPPHLAFGSRTTAAAGARGAGEGLPSVGSPPRPPGPPCQGWWLAEGLPAPGGAPSAAGGSLRRVRCQFPCELAPQAAPEAPAEKAGEDGL